MRLTDYIYFKVYSFYKSKNDDMPGVYAVSFIVVVYFIHVYLVYHFLKLSDVNLYFAKVDVIIFWITGNILLALRYVRFKGYSDLKNRYLNDGIKFKTLVVDYLLILILSILYVKFIVN